MDASYQVSVHLAEGFQRHISVIQFKYMYRDSCILNTHLYIYLHKSYLSFNREDFLESTNKKQELPVAAMFVNQS